MIIKPGTPLASFTPFVQTLQNNTWIFPVLLSIIAIYIFIIFVLSKKQYKDEHKITNLFDKDGNRKFKRNHTTYHFVSPIFLMFLIIAFWWAILQIQV